ncbi:LAFA_0G20208g1_1 [Lachancea sp. 'fantastica']|nr:LAFA_0G20208g1_1 [Lachancea sp. 'fantastica']
MIFNACISNAQNHTVWRKVLQNLSTLHEDIKCTITQREFIVSSMNSTDTAMGQARFKHSFFESYEFKPQETVFGEDGLQQVQDQQLEVHQLYSFKINGKLLGILFRKPENDNIKTLELAIHNGATCPESLANRFQITIHTESLMVKEYVPNIVPIKYDPIVINLRYKWRFLEVYGGSCEDQGEQLDPRLLDMFKVFNRELTESYFNNDILSNSKKSSGELTPEDEINYLCCNLQLLKNFIDSCHTSATEEVKIEVSISKLGLTAFTKAIYSKNNDVLRNAIRATNIVSTNDLEHYCLFTTTGDENSKNRPLAKTISFGMRDFRNFVNMAAFWKGNQNVNIWFCRPGDPIFMELVKDDLLLDLVQVTESSDTVPSNGNKVHATRTSPIRESAVKAVSPRKSPLQNKSPFRSNSKEISRSPLKPKSLFTTDDDESQEQQGWKNPIRGKRRLEDERQEGYSKKHFEQNQPGDTMAHRTRTTIEWGNGNLESATDTTPVPPLDQRDLLKEEKRKFLRDLKAQREKDQSNTEDEANEEQLGPTQIDRPKGLFD